ncbi:MAG: recombinase family protein, partial [Lachnospiraceae bacterium]|nr:recombinase family protein [Lachnospiraceae bacterium]
MTQFPPTTRLACYPRVSTEEQKLRGLSIEAQTEALQAWADRNGIKDVTFYNDAGNSARKPYNKRPAMLRLLSDVRAGRIDLIIFTKLDRWFRNIAEYYKVQEILERHNVVW